MSTQSIIILAVAILVGFIIIRFIAKTLFRILLITTIAAVICYLIFFYKGGAFNKTERPFMLYELQSKYCTEKLDTVKCECIINPLVADLKAEYTPEQLADFSKDPVKSAEVMIKLLNENKNEITACLKAKNANYVWGDFINDIKSLKLGEKFIEFIKTNIPEEENKSQ
jgi:hypothetical protein